MSYTASAYKFEHIDERQFQRLKSLCSELFGTESGGYRRDGCWATNGAHVELQWGRKIHFFELLFRMVRVCVLCGSYRLYRYIFIIAHIICDNPVIN